MLRSLVGSEMCIRDRIKCLRKRIAVLSLLFFVGDYSYNGIIYAINDIGNNIYLNGVLFGFSEIIGFLIGGLVANTMKRETSIFISVSYTHLTLPTIYSV
eukprot:TRINITY_DN9459_c0_g1_i6.p1 TRINITY_DN9459_c0_g1~~TRINITY_DN9459_c0_g1_i6.p1  ORF type:complete len:100 (-),score=22.50 TRINITY_DN9459_c0_g1_i6:3-302(-)